MAHYKCFSCNKHFLSIDNLISQMKIFHLCLTKYECKQGNRSRHFSLIGRLRKHLHAEHTFPESHVPLQLENPIINFASSCDENVNISPKSTTAKHISESDTFTKDEENINLTNEILTFVALLYSFPSLPRNLVQIIISSITDLLTSVSQKVHDTMTSLNLNTASRQAISGVFKGVHTTFAELSTEYLRLSYFHKLNSYVPPQTIYFGEYSCYEKSKATNTDATMVYKKAEGQIIELRKILKLFLELPDVFGTIKLYMEEEERS